MRRFSRIGDGMFAPDDGGWNATASLWHLTGSARSWSERWVQIQDDPGSPPAGWDPDVLAAARNYRNLPTVPALWALDQATASFAHLSSELDHTTPFEHGDWGAGTTVCGGSPTSTRTTSSTSKPASADRSGPCDPPVGPDGDTGRFRGGRGRPHSDETLS